MPGELLMLKFFHWKCRFRNKNLRLFPHSNLSFLMQVVVIEILFFSHSQITILLIIGKKLVFAFICNFHFRLSLNMFQTAKENQLILEFPIFLTCRSCADFLIIVLHIIYPHHFLLPVPS